MGQFFQIFEDFGFLGIKSETHQFGKQLQKRFKMTGDFHRHTGDSTKCTLTA